MRSVAGGQMREPVELRVSTSRAAAGLKGHSFGRGMK
jgi:hypothetical protein